MCVRVDIHKCFSRTNILFLVKDTLKAFDDFKTKQKNCMKQYFLICKSMYILNIYSMHYTLRENTNAKKISFRKNKR